MQSRLEAKCQVMTQFLGPREDHRQQLKVLNRVVAWHGRQGIVYEADPRHTELVIEQPQPQEAKIVTIPGAREEGRIDDEHAELLNENESTQYRVAIARCNYLSRIGRT